MSYKADDVFYGRTVVQLNRKQIFDEGLRLEGRLHCFHIEPASAILNLYCTNFKRILWDVQKSKIGMFSMLTLLCKRPSHN